MHQRAFKQPMQTEYGELSDGESGLCILFDEDPKTEFLQGVTAEGSKLQLDDTESWLSDEDCKARHTCYSQLQECKDETFAFAVSLPGSLGVLPVGADRDLQTLEWEGGSRGSVEAY